MELLSRIYRLHQILSSRHYPISSYDLQTQLECSRATLNRVIKDLRETWEAPIVNSKGKGYFYDKNIKFQLPGIWFTPKELESLFSLIALMENIQPGRLSEILTPLKEKLDTTLAREINRPVEIYRIRILGMAKRHPANCFTSITSAVLERRKVLINYLGRANNIASTRCVSPQRLVFYRDNWYMDAWCHKADALRTFSLDRISKATNLEEDAIDISEHELDQTLASSYGIFSGEANNLAVLRFSPERSRWISDEIWHPKQQGKFLADGTYELHIPYGNPTELILDICRYGPDVEVIAPSELRETVATTLNAAAKIYY